MSAAFNGSTNSSVFRAKEFSVLFSIIIGLEESAALRDHIEEKEKINENLNLVRLLFKGNEKKKLWLRLFKTEKKATINK